jgi:hypothetical protein
MKERRVRVFFYGSFINREVLTRGGLTWNRFDVGRLWGFDIVIETLATLVRSERHCVYGIVGEVTHDELRSLYTQDWLGGAYLPEAVLVETEAGGLLPALCYLAAERPPARPAEDYIDWITRSARSYGFPDWYIDRIERFRRCEPQP